MKMQVTETYAGAAGLFTADQVIDLPTADLARLQKVGVKMRAAAPDSQTFAAGIRTKPVKSSPKTK